MNPILEVYFINQFFIMNRIISLLLFFLFLLAGCTEPVQKQKTCHLTGKVVDRKSKALKLINAVTGDYSVQSVTIPIDSNGNFSYDLKYDTLEAYELAFEDELTNGLWRPILFFPDADTLKFVLYPMEKSDSNLIVGGRLSQEKKEMFDNLMNRFYDVYMKLQRGLDSLKNCETCDPAIVEIYRKKIDSIDNTAKYYKLQFGKEKGDLFGFYQLLEIMHYDSDMRFYSLDTLEKYCNYFQQKFSGHPYVEISKYRFNALKNIKVGGRFIPFSAPDSTGKIWHVSDFILKNKLTLIDLWAPWCGPCIRKSRKLIPVYEQYKGLGFSIFAVVGGISDKQSYLQAIRKHPYPWLVASDINDVNRVWEKYGITKSGGKEFLIDNNGVIVAVDPTPEEIIKHLSRISR